MKDKQKKTLIILDIVEIILCFVGVFVFSLLFKLDTSMIRYLFLVGDIYVIYSGYQTLSSLEAKVQTRVVKNANYKVKAKYSKKLSA